jgi:hypothetical protein
MNRYAATLLLAVSLSAPLVMAQNRTSTTTTRYYDRTHKDYHHWNDNEKRNYGTFRTERRIPDHTFARAKRAEQQQYWNWRHEHPDEKR